MSGADAPAAAGERRAPHLHAAVPFLPSRDFEASLAFYERVGFAAERVADDLALLTLHGVSAYLQDFWAEELASNLIVQLRVDDADAWERHLAGIDAEFAGVKLKPAQRYPWGYREVHLLDPAGVLLQFSEAAG